MKFDVIVISLYKFSKCTLYKILCFYNVPCFKKSLKWSFYELFTNLLVESLGRNNGSNNTNSGGGVGLERRRSRLDATAKPERNHRVNTATNTTAINKSAASEYNNGGRSHNHHNNSTIDSSPSVNVSCRSVASSVDDSGKSSSGSSSAVAHSSHHHHRRTATSSSIGT